MDDMNNNGFPDNNGQQNDPYAQHNDPAQGYDPYNQPNNARYGDPSQGADPYDQPNNARYGYPQQGYDPYAQPRQGCDPYAQNPQYQQYVQNQYGGGVYSYPVKANEGLATASLVMGILALVSGITVYPPILFGILGLIFGIIYKCKHNPNGNGKAVAGIVCSSIAIVFVILMVVAVFAMMPQIIATLKETDPEMYDMYYDMFYDTYPQWFEGVKAVVSALFFKA